MIERTEGANNDFEQRLTSFLEARGWNEAEQDTLFQYIGHHVTSHEATLVVLSQQEIVQHRQDTEHLTSDHSRNYIQPEFDF